MNIDKTMYIFYCVIVLISILIVSLFSNYGKNIIDEPGFNMYFGWFIALLIFNLFNILVTLIYHYFMKDLVGPKGLKGEIGDRGIAGKDELCFCTDSRSGSITQQNIDMAGEVKSYSATKTTGSGGVSIITDEDLSSGNTLTVVQ